MELSGSTWLLELHKTNRWPNAGCLHGQFSDLGVQLMDGTLLSLITTHGNYNVAISKYINLYI